MQPTRQDPFQLVWPAKGQRGQVHKAGGSTANETPVVLASDLLLRHNARSLDPATAPQPGAARRQIDNSRRGVPGGASVPYLPTTYVADEILVAARGATAAELTQLRRDLNWRLGVPEPDDPTPRPSRDPSGPPAEPAVRLVSRDEDLRLAETRSRTKSAAAVRFFLESVDESPSAPPDPWRMVQRVRDVAPDIGVGFEVGLNHLMFASDIGGVGFSIGHSVGGVGFSIGHAVGPSEYAIPGQGGRAPVRWLGRPPTRTEVPRRPTVVVVDTGVADHPWFPTGDASSAVERWRYEAATGAVIQDDLGGGEGNPNLIDPLVGLIDPFFGHGTFIAGLIHQICPDANISSIKMMGTDGIVEEAALLNGLGYLHQRQVDAMAALDDDVSANPPLIDVVSLSLGYYHEAGDTSASTYDNQLKDAVEDLGRLGVLVVAAAGNNATTQPLLPAAFSPYRDGVLPAGSAAVPLVSVGALNPDGTVALFSNEGSWVACHTPGAALVSTLPVADAGQQSGVDLSGSASGTSATERATIDPDSFSGFGTWSGTSFAAPVMAAAAAQALIDGGKLGVGPASVEAARQALVDLGFDAGSP